MKKMVFIVAALTLFSCIAGGIMAAERKAKSASNNPKFKGVIEKIDATARTFDVKSRVKVKGKMEDKVMTFTANDKTKVTKSKETMSFADLEDGMKVSGEYKVEEGKNIALVVKIAVPRTRSK